MVLFVDLEDENEPPEQLVCGRWSSLQHDSKPEVARRILGLLPIPAAVGLTSIDSKGDNGEVRENPNKNSLTEALGCYPIITSIASHIDLNSLDALSRTCRQIHVNLIQFRTQLIISTLHCENEDVELDPENTFRYRARAADWYFVEAGRDVSGSGKVGGCARDMVGGCRRCGRVVCRNCTIKAPAPVLLRHRHRRICKTCSKVPISSLISPNTSRCAQKVSVETLKRSICGCPTEGVWLCQPCGRSLRSADNEYESIWKWRTRYLPSLGGLGTGIGEGDRGVPCGRGGECIAAREVEQETDCDAEDARESDKDSRTGSPGTQSTMGSGYVSTPQREFMGPGYMRHEIEGIGGVVKKKLVKMVRVGACVTEWGDERDQGKFLVREIEGRSRSWCGWCWRVIPGIKDVME